MTTTELYTLFLQYPEVCTDTRKLSKNCLFFALKGDNFNGNTFAQMALDQGAAYCIVDEAEFVVNEKCILVSNVLNTLQDLAKYHRHQLNLPVIAIVGSNGKTTTKELISSVLQTKYSILSTPGNFNNHIGLPLTLLMLTKKHEIAVIEMGANHQEENAFLCQIACPSHGIVTNNGKDHLEGFGSMEGVILSNAELFDYLKQENGIAFVNGNDSVLMNKSEGIQNRIIYAAHTEEKIDAQTTYLKADCFQPTIQFKLQGTEIISPLSGDYNFDNILAALSIGLHFGLTAAQIKQGIEQYEPKNLRSQLIEKEHNKIFLDAYNANPSSMEVSIRNFVAMPGSNKVLILGDMFELGKYEAEEHQSLVEYCQNLGLEDVILVGKAFCRTNTAYKKFEQTKEVAAFLTENPFKNKFVFLKGSRGMKIESLIENL
ncbi:MAG: UDP-N-acetylmuramoyl-tripeptide--D-alanyl-D-alanine ligase [Bacteroidetes bacterium B1(2017)]|nr:MAG: UDP-N-acetylmuramoyl-tripeptide--D-alanyl-D-alanine ligase [Bacteroidetes bacterium B1(2017)]